MMLVDKNAGLMIKYAKSAFLTFCLISSLCSCTKKQVAEVDNESQSLQDYAIAEQEFMGLVPQIYELAMHTSGLATSTYVPGCDSLHYLSGDLSDFSPNPVFTLELNTLISSCAGIFPDGKGRTGKISVRFQAQNKTITQLVIKLQNYQSGGITFACDSLVATAGTATNTANSVNFDLKLVNGLCKSELWLIKYNMDTHINFDPSVENTAIQMYGTGSGTSRDGLNFVRETAGSGAEDWIVKHKNCAFIEKGLVKISPNGLKPRLLDFGNGNCDEEATFTINENTVAFKLK